MRRSLAAALLGISLWIGTLAWSAFLMTRTVLDPGRSEAVADALLEDDAVRAQLEANIAGGVAAALPPGAPVDRSTIEAGAETALRSPAVEALVHDALVRSHQAFLGEGEPPRAIDGGAFGSSAREDLVRERPELDGVLPDAPAVEVPLPTERIPDAGPVREALLAAVPVLAVAATIGASLALFVTTDRPAVIRRAGVWAVGLSTLVLLFAFGVPALAQEVAPAQATIVAALVSALAASTRGPALALAGAGAAAILLSLLWRPATRRSEAGPAPRRPPRAPRAANRRRRDLPTPARATGATPTPDPTSVLATPSEAVTRVEATRTSVERRDARWIPGVGWVHEGPEPVPSGARWVAGVGYVLDDGGAD